ncbi:MAG TPA: translation initiation factor [Anaerolineae bacterium]|nr:translation initiation factor [Anaerolineae bacterium]HMR66018.1 translation initiation factor [Anaerolineae bacterium]
MSKQKGKLVYSTHTGDLRKQAGLVSGPSVSQAPNQQNLRIRRETSGRKGKTVTAIYGFELTEDDLKAMAKTLKALCGAGGTAKSEEGVQSIELQGDHREKVADKLKEMGYKVKFAGG